MEFERDNIKAANDDRTLQRSAIKPGQGGIALKKMTSRKQQAILSKRHILETAFALTEEKGFDSLTIQDICRAADVSVGAFYHYFASKEALILEWYGVADDYFQENVIPRLEKSDADITEKIIAFAEEQVGLGVRYGSKHISRLYRAQLLHNNEQFFSMERGMVNGMVALLESGVEKGELKEEVVTEDLAHELFIIIRGITLDWLWGGTKEPKTHVRNMVTNYLSLYRK